MYGPRKNHFKSTPLVLFVLAMSATISCVVMADGNETLGPPSIAIASGSGIVAAGTGMKIQPATLELEVPGTAVAQALLYWNGEGAFAGDDTIDVEIGGQNHVIVGDQIGGPEFFFAFGGNDFYSSTYRADVTDLIHTGANTLTISGLDFVTGDLGNGAGLLVIFDDGTTSAIDIRDGQDIAFARFPATRDAVVPQTFAYAASLADQVATVQMFFASVGEERPNLIRITVDGGGVTELIDPLGSNNGEHWDTLSLDVDIPPGSTSFTIEAISFEDGSGVLPASLTWIAAGVAIEPPPQELQDCCEFGKPRTLTMRYTGDNCDVTSHSQDDGKVACEGDPAGLATVHIIASDKDNLDDSRAKIWFDGLVDLGNTFELDAWNAGSGDLKAKTFLHIFDPNGGLLQIVEFHTSCSQPLVNGDQFGSATLVGCIGKDTPVEGDCCVDGRPAILTLEYTGDHCDVTSHSQDPTKVSCEGDPAGLATVHIIASDKENLDDSRAIIWFDGLVNLGASFALDAANGNANELKAKTFLHIFDTGGNLLQAIEFHTSCSQPLVVGDRYGSATLVGCGPDEGTCDDGSCDADEDQCTCPADCGSPQATETNCTNGSDDDCDGDTDCADADCSGDPACDQSDCCEFGKPSLLTLEYTGDDCSVTSHSQDPTKVSCEGDPAGLATVHIIATDKEILDDPTAKVWFDGLVNLGGTFDLDAANGGANELKAKTFLHILDPNDGLLQSVEFHTSCSQPLMVGDRFGSATLVGCGPDGGDMTDEGYILSKNADFSTDDRTYARTDTLYILVFSDQVDFNDIRHADWELKDADKHKVKQNLTNNADMTYTAEYDLSNLPSGLTAWRWKGKVEDHAKKKFQPTANITVLP